MKLTQRLKTVEKRTDSSTHTLNMHTRHRRVVRVRLQPLYFLVNTVYGVGGAEWHYVSVYALQSHLWTTLTAASLSNLANRSLRMRTNCWAVHWLAKAANGKKSTVGKTAHCRAARFQVLTAVLLKMWRRVTGVCICSVKQPKKSSLSLNVKQTLKAAETYGYNCPTSFIVKETLCSVQMVINRLLYDVQKSTFCEGQVLQLVCVCDVASATKQCAKFTRNLVWEFLTNSYRLNVIAMKIGTITAYTLGSKWIPVRIFLLLDRLG